MRRLSLPEHSTRAYPRLDPDDEKVLAKTGAVRVATDLGGL